MADGAGPADGANGDANAPPPPKPFTLSFAKVAPRPTVDVAGKADAGVTREPVKGVEGEAEERRMRSATPRSALARFLNPLSLISPFTQAAASPPSPQLRHPRAPKPSPSSKNWRTRFRRRGEF